MNLRSILGVLPPKIPYRGKTALTESLALPEKLTLLWAGGVVSDIVTRVSDQVKTGQNLASKGRTPFVSTATGTVNHIGAVKSAEGHQYVAVSIIPDPTDIFDPGLSTFEDFSAVTPVDLRAAINRAGFRNLSDLSNDPVLWPQVDMLIMSAFDRDPLSLANQQTFRDHLDQVEAGMQLLSRAVEASRCVLAVPDSLAAVAGKLSLRTGSVVRIPAFYPNGLKEMLAMKYGTGLLLKAKKGGVVGNTLVVTVEDALAMVSSLHSGSALMNKTLTLTNGMNGEPKNFLVRIGTPVRDILDKAGVTLRPQGKLIVNGVMGGYACFSDEQPITSETESIHLQNPSEVFRFQDAACTNCGKCNAICPVDLEVNLLGRYSEYGIFEKCRSLGAENCIECGLCAYVCPARRPLVHLISHAKQVLRTMAMEGEIEEGTLPSSTSEASCPTIRLFEIAPEEESPSIRHS